MPKSCCVKEGQNRQKREQDWRCFSIPSLAISKGKEMEELTSRRPKKMAGSTETQAKILYVTLLASFTQGFHVHQRPYITAFMHGEERCMQGESKARRTVCSDFFFLLFLCLQSCSQPSCLITADRWFVGGVCVCMRARVCVCAYEREGTEVVRGWLFVWDKGEQAIHVR